MQGLYLFPICDEYRYGAGLSPDKLRIAGKRNKLIYFRKVTTNLQH